MATPPTRTPSNGAGAVNGAARHGPGAGRRSASGAERQAVPGRRRRVADGDGRPEVDGRSRRGAAFFDLDRTLLSGASGLVLSTAMKAEGLFDGRLSLPGERLFYGVYEAVGESLPFMAMVRAAVRFVKGWPAASVRRAGEVAAPQLLELLQPYAPGVLAEHRQAGRRLVLATTSPVDLVTPFARMLGIDDVVATRYDEEEGRYTGRIDGEFVWGIGKLAAVRRHADEHRIDLDDSFAYSDSVFDVPLLSSVGHPVAVQPDASLRLVATLARWPVRHWDRPPGVPRVAGLEAYHVLRPFVRPESFPYARFDIAGVEHIPARGPVLLAANHRSYFDVVALAIVAAGCGRPVRFLGKKELFDAPMIGALARSLGGICVDRKGDALHALVEARRVLQAGEPVLIMPQGTIPRGRDFFDPVLHGKTGCARLAAMTGAPVVPIGLWGTEQVWPRSARLPNVTTVRRPPAIGVRVGAPIDVQAAAQQDPVAATELIMAAIAAQLPLEARTRHEPTAEELARAVPPGHRSE